jgi:hypothetical protein
MEGKITLLSLPLLWLFLMPFVAIASAQTTDTLPQVVVTGSTESLTFPDLNSVAERFHDIPGAVSVYYTPRTSIKVAAALISKIFSRMLPVC